jgi:hypothetical protein
VERRADTLGKNASDTPDGKLENITVKRVRGIAPSARTGKKRRGLTGVAGKGVGFKTALGRSVIPTVFFHLYSHLELSDSIPIVRDIAVNSFMYTT